MLFKNPPQTPHFVHLAFAGMQASLIESPTGFVLVTQLHCNALGLEEGRKWEAECARSASYE